MAFFYVSFYHYFAFVHYGILFALSYLMKKIYIILIVFAFGLSSCRWTNRSDTLDETAASLSDLLFTYDLWYVDIDKTTGTGNVPFMSRAFTISFLPGGEVYANDNMVGLGYTGDGLGIRIGFYTVYNQSSMLSIDDDISGQYDFEVAQINNNTIRLHNRAENVTYFLTGYLQSQFDYDALFYDNVTYFLQEYEAWHKVYEDLPHPSEPFVAENHLRFYVNGNTNVFDSSTSPPNWPLTQLHWDYYGDYEVVNTRQAASKKLFLYYNINNQQESFVLTVLNDQRIRLTNLNTGNVFEFEGAGYIQYRPQAKRLKKKIQTGKALLCRKK